MSTEALLQQLIAEIRLLRSTVDQQKEQFRVLMKLSAGVFADSLDIALQEGNYQLLDDAIRAGVNLFETDILYAAVSDPKAVKVIITAARDVPINILLTKNAAPIFRRLTLLDGVAFSGQTELSRLLSDAPFYDKRYRMPLREALGTGFAKLLADPTSLQKFIQDFQATKIRRCVLQHEYADASPETISFAATIATITPPDLKTHSEAFWAVVKVDGRQTHSDLEELEGASAIPAAKSYASIYRSLVRAKIPSASINLAAEACYRSPVLIELIQTGSFRITPATIQSLEQQTSGTTRLL